MQVFGVVVLLFGVAALFFFPIGTTIGLFIMIGAARMGHKRQKVWLCPNCGCFFQRA